MIALVLVALCVQETKQSSTYFHSGGYSPDYLLRTRPWQGIAVDSRGLVYVAHPQAIGPENRRVDGGQIRIFDLRGDEVASCRSAPNGMATAGLAVNERNDQILVAVDQRHVWAFERKGAAITRSPSVPVQKERGRCGGVSVGRSGDLFYADMGESKVFRFHPGGGSSSFGNGPGGGDQGFNHLRRVFESPVSGNLFVLDGEGVRVFSTIGSFLRRIGRKGPGGILAMGADGRVLVGSDREFVLMDGEGNLLKRFPLSPDGLVNAALAGDGSFYVIPRGEEFCAAAYDAEGRALWRRGSDFDRLSVTLRRGPPLSAEVELTSGLSLGLLTPGEAKADPLQSDETSEQSILDWLESDHKFLSSFLKACREKVDRVTPIVLAHLQAPGATNDIRERALTLLGRIGANEAVAVISKFARTDAVFEVRIAAIRSLGDLRLAVATPDLLEICKTSRDSSEQFTAVRSLGEIGALEARAFLAAVERDGPGDMKEEVRRAITKIDTLNSRHMEQDLARLTSGDDLDLRCWAIDAIVRAALPLSAYHLRQALPAARTLPTNGEGELVQYKILKALQRLNAELSEQEKEFMNKYAKANTLR